MKKTKVIVLNALLSAMGSALLCLGSVLGDLDLTFAAAASITVFWAALELGLKSASAVWLVTSLLSMMIAPAKFAPMIFAVFVGIYPILKLVCERFRPLISWTIKIAATNVAVVILTLIWKFILFPSEKPAWWVYVAVIVLSNITVVVFDYLLGQLALLYFGKLKKKYKIFNIIDKK